MRRRLSSTGMRMKGKVGEGADPVDFSTMEPVGKCPKCGSGVFELESAYICEVAAKKEKPRKCDFRSGRVILQQPIEREQMVKLLTDGKTDLLTVHLHAHQATVPGVPRH